MFVLLTVLLIAGPTIFAQQQPSTPDANPARPTIATPATLTPVGYLQFETGYLAAWRSPEFSSQSSINEVIKLSVARRLELIASAGPFAYSKLSNQSSNDPGDVLLGFQAVIHHGEGARPTVSLSYFRRVYDGSAPNLDIGSPLNSALVLASADVKGFHYDANAMFNEVVENGVQRAQFGHTLSVSHPLGKKLTLAGELWRFTQPFLRSNAVGSLWAVSYTAKPNLVIDAGFDRGLTGTSTHWQAFAGFTYLLPRRLFGR